MTTETIKITGSQFTANSSNLPNNVSGSAVLRILNTSTGLVTITVANNGANVGSVQILSNTVLYLQKYPSDQVYCSNNSNLVFLTPVAFTF